ncbi:MAG: hypothetical protein RL154_1011 [Pseudomonadota bacterium]
MNKFDTLAKTWDENPSRVAMATLFANLISNNIQIAKTDTILDYGCGTGTCALSLSEFASKVIGVDASLQMLEKFREKAKDFTNDFTFLHTDLQSNAIKLPNANIIISTMTFHHLDNITNVISKFYEALTPNGFAAIADLDTEDGTFHDDGNDGVKHFGFDRDYIIDILKNCSFGNINAETAKTITKNNKEYSIFLITAQKIL